MFAQVVMSVMLYRWFMAMGPLLHLRLMAAITPMLHLSHPLPPLPLSFLGSSLPQQRIAPVQHLLQDRLHTALPLWHPQGHLQVALLQCPTMEGTAHVHLRQRYLVVLWFRQQRWDHPMHPLLHTGLHRTALLHHPAPVLIMDFQQQVETHA